MISNKLFVVTAVPASLAQALIIAGTFKGPVGSKSTRVGDDDKALRAALVIILLLAILAGAVFVGHYGWVSAGDVVMPAWGWLMLGLGVFFTLLVGGGLMALVFYSSREGFDEPPELAQKKKRRAAKWAKMVPRRKKPRSS